MLRLASDADVHGDIIRGLRRRLPEIDLVRAQDVALVWHTGPPRRSGEPPGVGGENKVLMRRTARNTITQALIRRIVKRNVQQFDPEQVILCGSQARGDAGPDSDVDLLVVMDV